MHTRMHAQERMSTLPVERSVDLKHPPHFLDTEISTQSSSSTYIWAISTCLILRQRRADAVTGYNSLKMATLHPTSDVSDHSRLLAARRRVLHNHFSFMLDKRWSKMSRYHIIQVHSHLQLAMKSKRESSCSPILL